MFEILLTAASIAAGAIASVSGFGIGSILTPILSVEAGAKIAVAAVSIPHFFATLLRFLLLRKEVDRRVLASFGVLSAAGGLAGALLHTFASNPVLAVVFAGLLIFAGIGQWTGWTSRLRFGSKAAWAAGAVSGLLGGLVGNQGGIRSAALLGFHLEPRPFVATATGIGLIVDVARMPLYFAAEGRRLTALWFWIALATAGCLAGTVFGERFLRLIPSGLFRKLVAAIILALGIFMLAQAVATART